MEKRAEAVSRVRDEWFMLHVECTDGKLQVCASHRRTNRDDDEDYEEEHVYEPWLLDQVLALLDWA